jgi:cobalt-zinc-cadmium efflux system outer membrane protein
MKTLRLDAANAFIESLRAREILARRKYALGLFESLEQQAAKPSKDAPLQTQERSQLRLELSRLRGDYFQAESDAAIADRNLLFYLGESKLSRTATHAHGSLDIPEVQFVEADLQQDALTKRPDLASVDKAMQAARAKSNLARENRNLDLGFTVGVTHTQPLWSIPDAGGTYSPGSYPMSNGLIATMTIPIPLSLMQDGDLRGPAAAATQAEIRLRELQGKARIEAQQALIKYRLSHRQVSAYRAGKADADILMQDTLKKYAAKESGFPDIVYYVRTANEVYFAYLEALAASAKALVSVYQASGRWEFDLQGN